LGSGPLASPSRRLGLGSRTLGLIQVQHFIKKRLLQAAFFIARRRSPVLAATETVAPSYSDFGPK